MPGRRRRDPGVRAPLRADVPGVPHGGPAPDARSARRSWRNGYRLARARAAPARSRWRSRSNLAYASNGSGDEGGGPLPKAIVDEVELLTGGSLGTRGSYFAEQSTPSTAAMPGRLARRVGRVARDARRRAGPGRPCARGAVHAAAAGRPGDLPRNAPITTRSGTRRPATTRSPSSTPKIGGADRVRRSGRARSRGVRLAAQRPRAEAPGCRRAGSTAMLYACSAQLGDFSAERVPLRRRPDAARRRLPGRPHAGLWRPLLARRASARRWNARPRRASTRSTSTETTAHADVYGGALQTRAAASSQVALRARARGCSPSRRWDATQRRRRSRRSLTAGLRLSRLAQHAADGVRHAPARRRPAASEHVLSLARCCSRCDGPAR